MRTNAEGPDRSVRGCMMSGWQGSVGKQERSTTGSDQSGSWMCHGFQSEPVCLSSFYYRRARSILISFRRASAEIEHSTLASRAELLRSSYFHRVSVITVCTARSLSGSTERSKRRDPSWDKWLSAGYFARNVPLSLSLSLSLYVACWIGLGGDYRHRS